MNSARSPTMCASGWSAGRQMGVHASRTGIQISTGDGALQDRRVHLPVRQPVELLQRQRELGKL
jgi:hypothetical protein